MAIIIIRFVWLISEICRPFHDNTCTSHSNTRRYFHTHVTVLMPAIYYTYDLPYLPWDITIVHVIFTIMNVVIQLTMVYVPCD